MKKKYNASFKDKKDWINFTKQLKNVSDKEDILFKKNHQIKEIRKLDLHGYSLDDANNVVKKFIIESFEKNYKKLLVVTGKGLRSKSYDNPYLSEHLSVLKNSVPEYIKNDENLNSVVIKITQASQKDGSEGAINIFLKDNKKFIK